MPTITSISPQKRNPERVNIFVDDKFAFGLTMVAATGLKIGTILTPELKATLDTAEELQKTREKAYTLLSYRPRSIREVRQKLQQKKIDDAVIDQVLDDLIARGYLDDTEFAKYWIDQRESFKPRGRRALQMELRQKGVDREIIEDLLQDLEELESARRAAENRAARWAITMSFDDFRKKLTGFLQRRGFDYGTTKQVVNEAWATHAPESNNEI